MEDSKVNEQLKAIQAVEEAKDSIEEKKPERKQLDSVTVLELQQEVLDLLHEVDSNPDKHWFYLGELVDGIIANYIDLHQPTSPTNAAWIEDAIDKAMEQAAKEGIHIRPLIRILENKREFALNIDYKVYRLDEEE
jgi:bifunctional N-acetylglucosamine-1-phosphate-uridyltransferase/glucosamine-1-phosphate-acetyltransferase GlmU-like protein